MKKILFALSILSILSMAASAEDHAGHGHEKVSGEIKSRGKPATKHTLSANKAFAKQLNFADVRAFENNDKNLLVPLDAATQATLRDRFKQVHTGQSVAADAPDTVNPSLWRQAQLNFSAAGLYKVTDGIYQVRGTDLSSMSFIRGKSGWIVYDVLMTREAGKASLDFFMANAPEKGLNVVAMIYSHSHADHFGGARSLSDLATALI